MIVPATVEAAGRMILGNWSCRIRLPRAVTEVVASMRADENHCQGRIAANRKSGASTIFFWKTTVTRIE